MYDNNKTRRVTTWNEPETSATLWQMHLSARAREEGGGNGFPLLRPPGGIDTPATLRLPLPPPCPRPRKPSSLRLTHPFGPRSLTSLPPCPASRAPFAQRLSLWSVSSHFLAIPSGNYYKSESQSIFNPRGMGVRLGRRGEGGAEEGGQQAGAALPHVQRRPPRRRAAGELMQQCQ